MIDIVFADKDSYKFHQLISIYLYGLKRIYCLDNDYTPKDKSSIDR
jgi:hypothetical protein